MISALISMAKSWIPSRYGLECLPHACYHAFICHCMHGNMFLFSIDDVVEAYNLIKDLEPTTPSEYILKGTVTASLGQEQNSVLSKLSQINFSKCLLEYQHHCNLLKSTFFDVCAEKSPLFLSHLLLIANDSCSRIVSCCCLQSPQVSCIGHENHAFE